MGIMVLERMMILQISLDLPDGAASVPLCRQVVRRLLQDLGVETARADDIELALSEAAGNVVRHAYAHPGHRYRVVVAFFTEYVRLQVKDEGRGFSRGRVPDPDEEQLGGRGIWLIEQLADVATISTLPGGGCLLEADFALPQPIAIISPAPPASERVRG